MSILSDVAAYPESVNVLDGIEGDIRTPDKLINNNRDNINSEHNMWLSPILPGIVSSFDILFSDFSFI